MHVRKHVITCKERKHVKQAKVPGFLFCAGREFVLSPMQLRVIDDGCCHFSVNSVRWGSVVDAYDDTNF